MAIQLKRRSILAGRSQRALHSMQSIGAVLLGQLILIFALGTTHVFAEEQLAVPSNGQILTQRVNEAERQFQELRKQLLEEKARLRFLRDQVGGNFDSDARLVVIEHNQVGYPFQLVETKYYMDGKLWRQQSYEKNTGQDIIIFDGFIGEGVHQLEIEKTYTKGGLATLFRKKQVKLKKRQFFRATNGKSVLIDATAHKKGSFLLATEKSLEIRFEISSDMSKTYAGSLARLKDAEEQLLEDHVAPAHLSLVSHNFLGDQYRLYDREILLDGKPIGPLAKITDAAPVQEVFEAPIPDGDHRIDVVLYFRLASITEDSPRFLKFKVRFQREIKAKLGDKTVVNLFVRQENLGEPEAVEAKWVR